MKKIILYYQANAHVPLQIPNNSKFDSSNFQLTSISMQNLTEIYCSYTYKVTVSNQLNIILKFHKSQNKPTEEAFTLWFLYLTHYFA